MLEILKHLPGQHNQQTHSGDAGNSFSAIAKDCVGKLKDLATTPMRKKLLKAFKQELEQAMQRANIVPEQLEELWVFGSFSSDKPKPGDMDLIAKVAEGTKLGSAPKGQIFNPDIWAQDIHYAPIAFTNDRQFLSTFLDNIAKGAPEGYHSPRRIYP